jgi:hypothetical protein
MQLAGNKQQQAGNKNHIRPASRLHQAGSLNCITNTGPLPSFAFSAHILPFISAM